MLNRKVRMSFVFLLVATMGLASVGTAFGAPVSQPLTTAQEATVDGTGCDFLGGFGAGLGFAAAFGCLLCGIGAAAAGAAYYVGCTK